MLQKGNCNIDMIRWIDWLKDIIWRFQERHIHNPLLCLVEGQKLQYPKLKENAKTAI